jgi:mRNA interferase RelE/StbE
VSWAYNISERALKQLKKLDPQIRKRIIDFLDDRITGSNNPKQWGKQLKGELKNIWRYRVGDYRILCQLQGELLVVLIVDVAHRRDVYR